MIYLLDKSGKIIDTKTLAQAELMAKKQKLILVKKNEQNLKYDAYTMIDPRRDSSYEDDYQGKSDSTNEKDKSKTRERKKIHLGVNISTHDIKIKSKQIKKWLTSNCDVQISVYDQKASPQKFESFYSKFMAEFDGFRVVQKTNKDNHLKFTLLADNTIELSEDDRKESSNIDDEAILQEILKQSEDLDKLVEEQLKRTKKDKPK